MARDIPLGNGRLLVASDSNGLIRDFYYPHVGEENHTGGAPFRIGLWEEGFFEWLPGSWQCSVGYLDATLVSRILWTSSARGLSLEFNDLVEFQENLLLRRVTLSDSAGRVRRLRLFFAFDFNICGNDIGDTAALRPETGGIVHYKQNRYFLINALLHGRIGFDQHATGNKQRQSGEGTWRDAEDGLLGGNPIAQGSVDSVAALHLTVAPGASESLWLWVAAGDSWATVRQQNQLVVKRGPDRLLRRTYDYWRLWASKEEGDTAGLPSAVAQLYRRSLLTIRTQIDRNGAIVAANDSDNIHFNRDTYSYVWPRDGALVAHALDLAGYPELSCDFFRFCAAIVEPTGYFLHKYTPSGLPASSWHPWVRDGRRQLPIQEDETALVLWALWEHYRRYRDIDFITPLYRPLIKNGANFLMSYRDNMSGLPLPSYDLWEEQLTVALFTVAAVHGGLTAAANFVAAFGEEDLADDYRRAAGTIREAVIRQLYREDGSGFARGLLPHATGEGAQLDPVVDASICGIFLFGLLPADDPRVTATMQHLHSVLWCTPGIGGLARYQHDRYYSTGGKAPGNPWFVTTLWYAQYLIARAVTPTELEPALKLLEWCADHALPSGILAEQLDPDSGEPLSVSPLTWSHATYVATVCAYRDRQKVLRRG
ncbi:MAG: glycoside hydrolase family 15 protein [Desulfuromonadales bacterium]|nr:glycoside hydrolase family 15 protein [Desulfuromonadales bacterium]